jgi:hypothetical protein
MTTINRNNYEEIFLLYVDNELDAESRLAVENFMQQNPDLVVEFEMLMQTRSVADETIFFDKDILLRTEGDGINETNYGEYFLLYIDNELSAAKREEVERYVLQHPRLQDEFTTLKQAVLAPEMISYGNKKDLYRTERRRTVYLRSWRWAAAAIFTGVCAIGWWLMEKPATTITVAVDHSAQHQSKQNTAVTKRVDSADQGLKPKNQNIEQPEQIIAQQSSSTKKEHKSVTATAVKRKKKENATDNPITENKNDNEPLVPMQQPVIEHPDIVKDQKEPPVETQGMAAVPEDISQKQNELTTSQTPGTGNEDYAYNVYPVAYKEINTNDDDRTLHVGMLDLNKDKVKTLFKKAGRMFGKKSNDLANEDGKLQVANFEIDTKKQ